jgi:hypothetical protein
MDTTTTNKGANNMETKTFKVKVTTPNHIIERFVSEKNEAVELALKLAAEYLPRAPYCQSTARVFDSMGKLILQKRFTFR